MLNCNLLALQNRHSRKQQDVRYLNPKGKIIFLVPLRIPLKEYLLTSKAENIFEKVSVLICDLRSLQNWHSRKQQDLSYLSPKEKDILVVPLNIPFKTRKVDTYLKLT